VAPGRSASQTALSAYRRFLGGDVGPLVEILSSEVEWRESGGSKLALRLRGRDEIMVFLNSRSSQSPTIRLRGLSITPSSIIAEFDDPWWDTRGRWRRWADSALAAKYSQTLTLTEQGLIGRITCSRRFATHTPSLSDEGLLLDMLIMR
jgi:hypothetical protein